MSSVRAAVYVRISDDREGAGLGVARQRQDCEALAVREGWTVAAVHVDNDLSAYSGKPRPGYQALLSDVRAGSVDAVVCWHPDRLHRSPVELEEFITLIEQTGVQVRTCTAGALDLSTASGRMTARVVGAVARHESEHKAERQRRKALQLAEQGLSNGGPRTFGYEVGHRQVRQDEAVLVREAAARALAGESLTAIARDWNVRGVPTVRGADGWTYQALRRMLVSPRHAGLRTHRGVVVAEAQWPAILDRDTHDQLVLRLRPGRPPATRVRKRLLTGLARCGRCGERLYSKVGSGRSAGTPVYRCVRVPGRGQLTACGGLSVVADPLDHVVGLQVLEVLDGPRLTGRLTATDRADQRTLTAALAADETRLTELAGDYAAGDIDRAEWRRARELLVERIDQTCRRLTEHTDDGVLAQLPTGRTALHRWWGEADVTARRAVVDALVDRVDVAPGNRKAGRFFDPGRVSVTWRT